jgi:hypothetical protein
MSHRLIFISLSFAALGVIAGAWRLHATNWQPPVPAPTTVSTTPIPRSTRSTTQADDSPPKVSQSKAIKPRDARRAAADYRQLVELLLPLASSGSGSAQYELADVLRYCDEEWHAHLYAGTGALRTPEQMRRLYASLPENTQALLQNANRRCHSFSENPDVLKTYSDWLEQAAKAGYPPAVFMKADLAMRSHLMDGDAAAIEQARQQAVNASTSADPDVLFGMTEFVSGTDKTQQQVGQLISAWWLLACQSGYDCGADSQAAQAICTVDPQCANKPTLVEYIQHINGARFGEVEQLAARIKEAIDSHDTEAINKYLGR